MKAKQEGNKLILTRESKDTWEVGDTITIDLKINENTSDGYHTFKELYEHRIWLWIALCRHNREWAWKSKKHSDGSIMKGWFILGIGSDAGTQMTYHLPLMYWDRLKDIDTVKRAYKYDGHTSNDVLNRLGKAKDENK